jgi:hypothetical protein
MLTIKNITCFDKKTCFLYTYRRYHMVLELDIVEVNIIDYFLILKPTSFFRTSVLLLE